MTAALSELYESLTKDTIDCTAKISIRVLDTQLIGMSMTFAISAVSTSSAAKSAIDLAK